MAAMAPSAETCPAHRIVATWSNVMGSDQLNLSETLGYVRALAPMIARLCGDDAANAIDDAIETVSGWWPLL